MKPLAREQHQLVFNSARGSTYLFGGSVPEDTTYGPSEFWEYLPNATARDNGAGCTARERRAASRGTASTASAARRPPRSATASASRATFRAARGRAATCRPASRTRHLPERSVLRRDPAVQGAARPRVHAFTDCASGHCADGVCCNSDCNGTCQQCNLAAKPGTCSPVPSGIEDPPNCTSDPVNSRFCDGSGVCSAGPRAGKPCTAGVQCTSKFCIDGFCCNSSCANTCYTCGIARTGDLFGDPAGPGGSQRHHDLRWPDAVLQRLGTCATDKKPNGVSAHERRLWERILRRQGLLHQHLPGDLPVVRRDGQRRHVRHLPPECRTRRDPHLYRQQFCDGTGACLSGQKANGTACAAARIAARLLRGQGLLRGGMPGHQSSCYTAGKRQVHRESCRAAPTRTRPPSARRRTSVRRGEHAPRAEAERRACTKAGIAAPTTASTRPAARACSRESA